MNVKIENYNHHDAEQLLFYKTVHIKTQCKQKDKKTLNAIKKNVKCHNST